MEAVDQPKISFEISSDFEVKTFQLPQNYTLFMNELRKLAFGNEADGGETSSSDVFINQHQPHNNNNANQNNNNPNMNFHHYNHGMSDAEYARFVSDMWIGIVLTMLMVLIVFALCFWYMYHKFQQWKRSYDSRSQIRHHNPDGTTINAELETLPNYTLVSGLPTYDDALEQLRLNSSTNHLLINHQTLMKLFGTSMKERTDGKDATDDDGLPTYEDGVRLSGQATVDGAAAAATDKEPARRPPSAPHRFICTIVPPSSGSTNHIDMCHHHHHRASSAVLTIEGDTENTTTATNEEPNNRLCRRDSQLIDVSTKSTRSLGSLNIVNEIKNSRPDMPWIHRSAMSLSCENELLTLVKSQHRHQHRASLY